MNVKHAIHKHSVIKKKNTRAVLKQAKIVKTLTSELAWLKCKTNQKNKIVTPEPGCKKALKQHKDRLKYTYSTLAAGRKHF